MINLTQGQIEYINDSKIVRVSMTVETANGETVEITGDELSQFSINTIFSTDNEINIGNAIASELRATIYRTDRLNGLAFGGAKITVKYTIDNTTINGGIYRVDSDPATTGDISIIALDKLAKFDNPLPIDLKFPMSARSLLEKLCNYYGVEYRVEKKYINDGAIITGLGKDEENLGGLTILGWLAGLNGSNAIIDSENKLDFITLDYDNTPIEMNTNKVTDYIDSTTTVSVTGVLCNKRISKENEDGDIFDYIEEHQAGDKGYVFDLSENNLVINSNNIQTILNNIYSIWGGKELQPFDNLTTTSLLYLQAGDLVQIPDKSKPSLITEHTMSLNGISTMTAGGSEKPRQKLARGGFSDEEYRAIASIAKRAVERVKEENPSDVETMINKLHEEFVNGLGYYQTIYKESNGQERVYVHDKPKLEESQYIEYKPSAGSLIWTNEGWNNGNPNWNSGYTKDGSLLMRAITTIRLNAEQIYVNDSVSLEDKLNDLSYTTNDLWSTITSTHDGLMSEIGQNKEIVDDLERNLSSKLTRLEQDFEKFSLTVRDGGGANLIKNSVGYGGTTHWKNAPSDNQGVNTWILNNSISKYGWVLEDNIGLKTMSQEIILSSNTDYSFYAKINKGNANANTRIELRANGKLIKSFFNEKNEGDFEVKENFNSGEYNDFEIRISYGGATISGQTLITDLGIYKGKENFTWQQNQGEVYTLNVNVDSEGVLVKGADGLSYTVMSPNEFAGYYAGNKVFTLNGDITEIKGLVVNGSGIDISPIKIVQDKGKGALIFVYKGFD